MNMHHYRTLALAFVLAALVSAPARANRLLEFCDSTDSYLAAAHVSSSNTTGWNDGTIYAGDLAGTRYHVLIAINDTLKFQQLFSHCTLDSAKLSFKIVSKSGTPGALDFHFIKRDSTGMGIYPAYDDSRSHHCRSEWRYRKGALPYACPDSILWQTPGATGNGDYNPVPFASVADPQLGTRCDVDITSWIAGIISATDSISNGILVLTSNENGSGTDFVGFRSIWPFFTGDDRMILKLWISNWDWIKVRLDLNRASDGWITAANSDTIYSGDGYIKVGTGAFPGIPNDVAVIFPDDSALFGNDAIPDGSAVDSARLYLFADDTFPAPVDFISAGEILPPASFTLGQFPTWDSVAPGTDWSSGSWSPADVVERDRDYVNYSNAWYHWAVGEMIQRWLDSASTRHGLALWETGPFSNRATAWIDRTGVGYGSRAGSLLVWFTPPQPRTSRRAWIDNPAPLK